MNKNIKYGVVAALTLGAFVAPSVSAMNWGATKEEKNTAADGTVTIEKTAHVTFDSGSKLVISGHDTYNGETIADVIQSAVIEDNTTASPYKLADKATDVYKDAGLKFYWDGKEVKATASAVTEVSATDLATAGDHTVKVADTTTPTAIELTTTVKIAKKTVKNEAVVTATKTNGDPIAYTGSALTNTDVAYYLDGAKLGASDIDDIEIKNSKGEVVYKKSDSAITNNFKDAGIYSVTVKAKESANLDLDGLEGTDTTVALEYSGTITIAPMDISGKKATLAGATGDSLTAGSYTYNGLERKPVIASTDAFFGSLTAYNESETSPAHTTYDYAIAYANNINVGTATATITGHGNYTGSITASFTIKKAIVSGTSATVPATSAIYRGTTVNPKKVTIGSITLSDGFSMTVADKGLDLVNVTGTQIPFTVSVDGTNVSTTSAGISGKFTIAPLNFGTGGTEATKDSPTVSNVTMRAKAADLKKEGIEILVIDPAYTGSEVLPTVKVYVDGDEVPASEYKISRTDGENAAIAKGATGHATITKSDIAKTSNVTGSFKFTFTVSDTASISDATISGIARAYTYNGESKEPAVSVSMNGATLVEGTDYVIVYKNNLKVGTATVTIKGTGSYTGSVTKAFYIDPAKSSIKKVAVAAKKMTVTVKKGTAASGVQIAYRVKGTNKWSYVKTTGTSKTISSLKKGKKYQVVVRSYTKKNGVVTNYSGWSATKTTAAIK